ncbi:hypothetical protein CES86_4096 [Brucella lupini]|uniref:Uncharacterized protein n=1 Tax=Brucella lupini TaxID=255457 RepID=A0A256GFZ5_9HYPH|nr:hypothetical protein CES86_4096 [Brucella lupini]
MAEVANIMVRRMFAIKSGKPNGYTISEFGGARLLKFPKEKSSAAR